jgi:type II secretory pathway pseudopilin PulG
LTIYVAIIGLLTAVAAPKFIAYRDRARTAAALASGGRGSLAAAAADYPNSLYPEDAKVTKASDLTNTVQLFRIRYTSASLTNS